MTREGSTVMSMSPHTHAKHSTLKRCPNCHSMIPKRPGRGKPRKWCSEVCRASFRWHQQPDIRTQKSTGISGCAVSESTADSGTSVTSLARKDQNQNTVVGGTPLDNQNILMASRAPHAPESSSEFKHWVKRLGIAQPAARHRLAGVLAALTSVMPKTVPLSYAVSWFTLYSDKPVDELVPAVTGVLTGTDSFFAVGKDRCGFCVQLTIAGTGDERLALLQKVQAVIGWDEERQPFDLDINTGKTCPIKSYWTRGALWGLGSKPCGAEEHRRYNREQGVWSLLRAFNRARRTGAVHCFGAFAPLNPTTRRTRCPGRKRTKPRWQRASSAPHSTNNLRSSMTRTTGYAARSAPACNANASLAGRSNAMAMSQASASTAPAASTPTINLTTPSSASSEQTSQRKLPRAPGLLGAYAQPAFVTPPRTSRLGNSSAAKITAADGAFIRMAHDRSCVGQLSPVPPCSHHGRGPATLRTRQVLEHDGHRWVTRLLLEVE